LATASVPVEIAIFYLSVKTAVRSHLKIIQVASGSAIGLAGLIG